jgi:hypothetical protein
MVQEKDGCGRLQFTTGVELAYVKTKFVKKKQSHSLAES